MADTIVACPSCGKKFRVAEDAEPGQFDCTNCGTAVPYGVVAAAPARALPARGGRRGGGGGRPRRGGGGRARPAGRARGGRRGGGGRYDDEYDMPPEKSNATLFIVLGIVGVLVVGGGIVLAITLSGDPEPVIIVTDRTPEQPAPSTYVPPVQQPPANTNPDGAQPLNVSGGSIDGAQPLNVPGGNSGIGGSASSGNTPDLKGRGTERVKPGGGGRSEAIGAGDSLYGLPTMKLRPLKLERLVEGLEHLEDTSPELKSEIDKLCGTLVDFFAGGAGTQAQKRLAEIGKPGVPMMIAAFLKAGDLGSREGMTNACVIDEALRMTVGMPTGMMELRQMANPSKNQIQRTAKGWAVWWFAKGHEMTSFEDEDDEEEEE